MDPTAWKHRMHVHVLNTNINSDWRSREFSGCLDRSRADCNHGHYRYTRTIGCPLESAFTGGFGYYVYFAEYRVDPAGYWSNTCYVAEKKQ